MARDYVSEYQALLPSGAAWPRAADSVATELARGLTAEFARVDDRAAQLLLEMDPRTTTELIADWERIAGLPDPCADTAPSTIEGRRAAVTARIIARGAGGPSVTFLTDVIVALGYDRDHIIIRRFHHQAFTCESACVDELNPEDAGWPYLWEIIVRHGSMDLSLVCQITHRYGLAHLALTNEGPTVTNFAFPLFFFFDGGSSRATSAVFTDPVTGEKTNLGAALGTFYFGV